MQAGCTMCIFIFSLHYALMPSVHDTFIQLYSFSMKNKYRSVPQIGPPSRISPPCIFSAKSCRGIFILRITPPPPPASKLLHSQVQGLRGGMAAPERSQHPQNCSVKLSTTNADHLQHRWTRQLLRGSALLPCPSTLKLTSLLLVSGASLRLALRAQPPLSYTIRSLWWNGSARTKSKNEVSIHRTARHFSIEGGGGGGVIVGENVASHV